MWPDVDNQPRGYNDPANANGSPGVSGGIFDVGADEVSPFLFGDGFESGDTAAWSAAVP